MHFAGQVDLLLTLGIFQIWIHWNGVRNIGTEKCVIRPFLPGARCRGDGGGGRRGRSAPGVGEKCAGTSHWFLNASALYCLYLYSTTQDTHIDRKVILPLPVCKPHLMQTHQKDTQQWVCNFAFHFPKCLSSRSRGFQSFRFVWLNNLFEHYFSIINSCYCILISLDLFFVLSWHDSRVDYEGPLPTCQLFEQVVRAVDQPLEPDAQ